jgi:hypothetical protein
VGRRGWAVVRRGDEDWLWVGSGVRLVGSSTTDAASSEASAERMVGT